MLKSEGRTLEARILTVAVIATATVSRFFISCFLRPAVCLVQICLLHGIQLSCLLLKHARTTLGQAVQAFSTRPPLCRTSLYAVRFVSRRRAGSGALCRR